MKKLIATCAMTFAFAGTAAAQDEEGDGMGGGMEEDTSGDAGGGGGMDTSGGGDGGGGGSGDAGYTMGISNTWPTGGDGGSANLLYAMGENWLDLQIGFNLDVVEATDSTTIGIELGAGYRMYKEMSGKVRPYIEPGILLTIGDFGDVGPTMGLLAFGAMGIDYALMDQFTLGTSLAAGLGFTNEFKDISFGLITTSINATFWWN